VERFTLEIDRRIVEGFLVDQEATLRKLASAGYTRKAVLDRAGKLGLTNDFLRKHRSGAFGVSVRSCLSCDETFVSVGPQNRLCNRCRKRQ
jgi:hypothetical protein